MYVYICIYIHTYIYIYICVYIYIYIYIYKLEKIDYLLTEYIFYFNMFIHCINQLTDLTCVFPNACS